MPYPGSIQACRGAQSPHEGVGQGPNCQPTKHAKLKTTRKVNKSAGTSIAPTPVPGLVWQRFWHRLLQPFLPTVALPSHCLLQPLPVLGSVWRRLASSAAAFLAGAGPCLRIVCCSLCRFFGQFCGAFCIICCSLFGQRWPMPSHRLLQPLPVLGSVCAKGMQSALQPFCEGYAICQLGYCCNLPCSCIASCKAEQTLIMYKRECVIYTARPQRLALATFMWMPK